MDRRIPCQSCRGSGKGNLRRNDTCWNCGGSGRVADPPKPTVVPARTKAISAKTKQLGSQSGLVDGIGKLLALGAAIAAGIWAKGAMPDAPAAWFIAAVVAGAVAYALRKLIILGAVAVGVGMAILDDDDGSGTQQAGVVPAPAARNDPGPGVSVIGLCLRNRTTTGLDYTFALPGQQHGDPNRIAAGEERVLWADEAIFDEPPRQLIIHIKDVALSWTLPLARTKIAGNGRKVQGDDISCGKGGLSVHEILWNGGKLGIRRVSA